MADHRDLRSLGPIALGVLTAAALGLRVRGLTRAELWVDEAATWWFGRLAASGQVLEQVALEPTPPLYYALVGGLMRLFGESEAVMRWPSAVFGALAVPAVYLLARTVLAGNPTSRPVAWVAAVWIAVHPLHVFYSREARVYPLLLVLTVFLWVFLWRALDADKQRDWAAVTVLLSAACYSHLFGLFLGATVGVAVLAWAPSRRARWRGLGAAALAGLLFAPYLMLTLPHLRTSGAAWSVEAMYRDLPEERRFGRSLEMQLAGAGYHKYMRHLNSPPTPVAVRAASIMAQAVLLCVALWGAVRAAMRRREVLFLAVTWLLPVVIPWAINHQRAFYQSGRHDVYVLGSAAVLLAVGSGRLFEVSFRRLKDGGSGTRTLAAWGVAFCLVLSSVGATHRLLALEQAGLPREHRATGAWIAQHATADDLVVAMGIRRLVSEHAAGLAGSDASFVSFPSNIDDHPGWSHDAALLKDEAALRREARSSVAGWKEELAPGAKVFVLLRSYQRTADAVSETWLVDHHLLESLHQTGWRRMPELEASELRIAAFHRP